MKPKAIKQQIRELLIENPNVRDDDQVLYLHWLWKKNIPSSTPIKRIFELQRMGMITCYDNFKRLARMAKADLEQEGLVQFVGDRKDRKRQEKEVRSQIVGDNGQIRAWA